MKLFKNTIIHQNHAILKALCLQIEADICRKEEAQI